MADASSFRAHGATNVGLIREANEDSLIVDPVLGLFGVFDGMGGAKAGDVASQCARDVVYDFVRAHRRRMDATELLPAALQAASSAVHREAQSRRDRKGMGTTAVVCLYEPPGRVVIAHVGDSRGYLLHDGRLQQLTRDHTVVAEMLASNAISAEDAHHHPYKSVLSRNLGAKLETNPEVNELTLVPGDRLLLCSDGLNGFASTEAIQHVMSGSASPMVAAQELIEAALRGGGGDNVTAIVFETGKKEIPRSTQITRTSGASAWWERREMFLQDAQLRGLAYSPICAILSPDEAVSIVAGNLCEAIYRDLQQATGLNVWTFAENLANGWMDQQGSYDVLRDLLDILRECSRAVVADLYTRQVAGAIDVDIAVTRAMVVAEVATAGVIAQRLRAVEAEIVRLSAHIRASSEEEHSPRTWADQPTVPFMHAVRVDPPSPDVLACLEKAYAQTQRELDGTVLAQACLDCIHRSSIDPTGPTDAAMSARDLYGTRTLEEGSIAPLLDALDTLRMLHLAAIRNADVELEACAGALRRAALAHQSLVFAVAGLVIEAGRPITERLGEAVEISQRLREKLERGERALNNLERRLTHSGDATYGDATITDGKVPQHDEEPEGGPRPKDNRTIIGR